MATQQPPSAIGKTVHRPLPTVPAPTTPVVVRGTTTSATSNPPTTPPHPAVYAPWTSLLAKAETRYKQEISLALTDLDRAAVDAGRLLDQAATMAAEAGAHLEQAAWAAWSKYMAMADDTRNEILNRARTAYDQAITYARGQYDRSLTGAEKTYQSIAADATRAQSDVKSIAS
jgi:hypothetical protein